MQQLEHPIDTIERTEIIQKDPVDKASKSTILTTIAIISLIAVIVGFSLIGYTNQGIGIGIGGENQTTEIIGFIGLALVFSPLLLFAVAYIYFYIKKARARK